MNEKRPVRRIGKYELIAKVAQGGMGALYKARHPTLDRVVLLKKLTLRGSSQFVERFKREARLMMDFKHEHIVHVYDHFKEGSSYYIVEEFVDGISLDALIRRERYLSNDAAMLILYEVSKALKYAHDKKVIHRDIKPSNILISRQGEVKLVDFGIATSQEETEDGLTRDGMVLGTPSYIPPEQIADARNVDKRADIYSLGVVLYEMLTGKTPFPGSFTAETVALIQRGRYTPPRRLNPRISPLLRKIVRKAMRVAPAPALPGPEGGHPPAGAAHPAPGAGGHPPGDEEGAGRRGDPGGLPGRQALGRPAGGGPVFPGPAGCRRLLPVARGLLLRAGGPLPLRGPGDLRPDQLALQGARGDLHQARALPGDGQRAGAGGGHRLGLPGEPLPRQRRGCSCWSPASCTCRPGSTA